MNYAVFEFKPISESPHRLAELVEVRGQLLEVLAADGEAVARFPWGAVSFQGELLPELAALVGKDCAILRLGGYHIREVITDA